MSDSVLDICGLGNIVKGVRKRKKKFTSPVGQRSYPCPNMDRWRSNESLHTLLSKLDIVEKKLGKFDQTYPLATQEQTVSGTRVTVGQNSPCSKLKVRLPDNWLNLMKDYETSGNRPCLEVSVKSEIDYKCKEQKGAIRGGILDQTTSRNQMVRLNNSETVRQEFGSPTGHLNGCLGDFGIIKQYSSAENLGPCGESPGIVSSPARYQHGKSTRPLWTTLLPSSNNPQVIPEASEARTCMEAASVMSTFGTPFDPSVFNTPVCNPPNALSNSQPATFMEQRDGENVEFMGYMTSNSGIPYEPKKGVCFDSVYLPNQKSQCTHDSCSSRTSRHSPRDLYSGYSASQNCQYASKCGDQQLSCPCCREGPPCCQEVSEPNISYKPSPSSSCGDQQSSCPSCRAASTLFCQNGFEQKARHTLGPGAASSPLCGDQPKFCCQDDSGQNMSHGARYGPYSSALYVSRGRDQWMSCCCFRTPTDALFSSTRREKNSSKPSSSPRNIISDKSNTVSPNCLCAQAICMIQNCSKHKDQPGPKTCQEASSVCSGSCASKFKTLIVNIPRTPIVTTSPADIDSDMETRNYAAQRTSRDESDRIAPIKSCECDIKEQTKTSCQKPDCGSKGVSPHKSSHSQKEEGRLEKQCTLSPSKDKPSHPHPENVNSVNDAASDASHTSKSSPQKRVHPRDENNSTKDAAPHKKKVSHSHKPSPEKQDLPDYESSTSDAPDKRDSQNIPPHEKQEHGTRNTENKTNYSALSNNKANPSSHERTNHPLYIKNGIEFEGQGESSLNPPGNSRADRKSDRAYASLLIASPPTRRGFVPLPLPPRAAPGKSEMNADVECDAYSCSTRLPKTHVKPDLFISEGTVLTSHPSNVATNQEYNGVYESAEPSISPSDQGNDSKSHNSIILPVHLPCCAVPSQLGNKKSSSLNEKYLKELMLPFTHQELAKVKNEMIVPKKTQAYSIALELFLGSKPEMPLTATCQTAIRERSTCKTVIPGKSTYCPGNSGTSTCNTTSLGKRTTPSEITPTFPTDISGKCVCPPEISETSTRQTDASMEYSCQARRREMSMMSTNQLGKRDRPTCKHQMSLQSSLQPDVFGTSSVQLPMSETSSFLLDTPGNSTCQTEISAQCRCQQEISMTSTTKPGISDASTDRPQMPLQSYHPDISGTSCLPGISEAPSSPNDIASSSTGSEQPGDGRAKEPEQFNEFLRDAIVKLFHSPLRSEYPRLKDSMKQGFQNQDTSMIFNQGTKSMVSPKPCHMASSSTEKHYVNNDHSSSEVLSDVEQNHCNTINDELKELIWNSNFNPSDTQESNETVYVPTADNTCYSTVIAHVNSDVKNDTNIVPQKSYTGLQRASEIMDLLEIFPGQHRQEKLHEERTRNWIENRHKALDITKDDLAYGKNIGAKAKKSRKKDCCSKKTCKARFFKKGWVIAKEGRNKNCHVPVYAVQSSSSVTTYDSSDETEEPNMGEQRYLVFMNESSLLSKERCKHGISNRLPKLPTHWFRGTDHDGYSIVQRIGNDDYSGPLIIEREPFKNQADHTHDHHKQRGRISDDCLRHKKKNSKKKEIIVRTPKRETVERQHRDIRVPSRSLSDCSSSNCSVHRKRQFVKTRHFNGNDRRHSHDQGRHDHKHSLDESHNRKYDSRYSKTKQMIFYEPKPKNEEPLKTALKKSSLRSVSSTTSHESDSSSSESSSCKSEACGRDKTHRFHGMPVKHPTAHAARHLKVAHSPLPVKWVKGKKKVPNTFVNFRQRLITPDSKSSANFEKVNVKDFIDFLATLSRNTISTLTNKKKALKLYRNYLSSPRRR